MRLDLDANGEPYSIGVHRIPRILGDPGPMTGISYFERSVDFVGVVNSEDSWRDTG
jgi:hypothetical protein